MLVPQVLHASMSLGEFSRPRTLLERKDRRTGSEAKTSIQYLTAPRQRPSFHSQKLQSQQPSCSTEHILCLRISHTTQRCPPLTIMKRIFHRRPPNKDRAAPAISTSKTMRKYFCTTRLEDIKVGIPSLTTFRDFETSSTKSVYPASSIEPILDLENVQIAVPLLPSLAPKM